MNDSLYIRWPKAEIEALLRDALQNGVSRVELETEIDAKNFRFALYNYRRGANSVEFKDLAFSVFGTSVTIQKTRAPELRRIG